jgi:hypothetical protein
MLQLESSLGLDIGSQPQGLTKVQEGPRNFFLTSTVKIIYSSNYFYTFSLINFTCLDGMLSAKISTASILVSKVAKNSPDVQICG